MARKINAAAAAFKKLRQEEIRLNKLRETIQVEKAKARRKASVEASESAAAGDEKKAHASSSASSSITTLLPKNRSLESSLALYFTSGRDPRIQLDVTQRLLGSTVISIAANVGPTNRWDPFDVKPQLFALGKHMGLPIFTSLAMLRHFCWKNNLWSVHGPDGAVWCDNGAAPPDSAMITASSSRESAPEFKSKSKCDSSTTSSAAAEAMAAEKHHRALLKSAEHIERFEMPTVLPLHTWGQPRAAHFFGYFGLLTTVFENASIVPGETDVVLNPGSPIELALSHGMTSTHFARNAADLMVHSAFLRVEKKIRSEFISLLSTPGACPEVVTARSATLRRGFGSEQMQSQLRQVRRNERRSSARGNSGVDDEGSSSSNEVVNEMLMRDQMQRGGIAPELLQPDAFDIVILLETHDFGRTARAVQRAKQLGILVGHTSLRVIPMEDAPPHVAAVSEIFFTNTASLGDDSAEEGGLELVGEPIIANAHLKSDNFYSNPDMAYTEPHALAVRKLRKF